MQWFFILLGLGIASMGYVIWALKRRRHSIPALMKQRLRDRWDDAIVIADLARRVLEAEKVCDAVLKALEYRGTFAEKLQSASPRLAHVEDLWSAHRLRNRIAHELNCRVSVQEGRRAVQAFATVVDRFLSR